MARQCCRRWSAWACQQARRTASSATWSARRARRSCARNSERRFEVGGVEEAVLRALVYIRLPEGSIDERGFAMLKLDPRVTPGRQSG